MSGSDLKVKILQDAIEIVGCRGLVYGTPEDNFKRIARRWNLHIVNRYGLCYPDGIGARGPLEFDETDVAVMMTDLKLARIENEPEHRDSWVDVCGYGACGGAIAEQRRITRSWAEAAGEDKAEEAEASPNLSPVLKTEPQCAVLPRVGSFDAG